jgi:hypothetical protein
MQSRSAIPSKDRAEDNQPSVCVYHDYISHFASMAQEVMCQLVGALVDLAICKNAPLSLGALGFNDAFSVWKAPGILCKYLVDGYHEEVRMCLDEENGMRSYLHDNLPSGDRWLGLGLPCLSRWATIGTNQENVSQILVLLWYLYFAGAYLGVEQRKKSKQKFS